MPSSSGPAPTCVGPAGGSGVSSLSAVRSWELAAAGPAAPARFGATAALPPGASAAARALSARR
eukprot:8059959-Alexandrium_andersonii.AAC.1